MIVSHSSSCFAEKKNKNKLVPPARTYQYRVWGNVVRFWNVLYMYIHDVRSTSYISTEYTIIFKKGSEWNCPAGVIIIFVVNKVSGRNTEFLPPHMFVRVMYVCMSLLSLYGGRAENSPHTDLGLICGSPAVWVIRQRLSFGDEYVSDISYIRHRHIGGKLQPEFITATCIPGHKTQVLLLLLLLYDASVNKYKFKNTLQMI